MPIKAKRVSGTPERPGEFKFTRKRKDPIASINGMMFCCPCGCSDVAAIAFDTSPTVRNPKWSWNGDSDRPTLNPSLQKSEGCKWHGFLIAGEFREVGENGMDF